MLAISCDLCFERIGVSRDELQIVQRAIETRGNLLIREACDSRHRHSLTDRASRSETKRQRAALICLQSETVEYSPISRIACRLATAFLRRSPVPTWN
jgi:hypothetical protein